MADMTVREVAALHGITPSRVCRLIRDGRLSAEKFAGVWRVKAKDATRFKKRTVGRPKKAKANGKATA